MKKALLALGFLFSLLCSPAQAERPHQDEWSYRGEITNIGTRSEGFVGGLAFDGKDISSKIEEIVTPIGLFKFKESNGTAWSSSGWIKVAKSAATPQRSSRAYDPSNEKESHWYRGDWRIQTPPYWVFLPEVGAWADPAYLNAFAAAELADKPEPKKSPFAALTEEAGVSSKVAAASHVYVYSSWTEGKGSKSQGFRGKLTFNGTPISFSGSIRTPLGTFAFANNEALWQQQGWFPIDEVQIKETTTRVTANDLKKKSYKGPHRVGTPSDWYYWIDDDTWHAPNDMN